MLTEILVLLIVLVLTATKMMPRRGLPRPRHGNPRLPVVVDTPPNKTDGESGAGADAAEPDDGVYQPTAMDVVVTKAMLQKALRLPAELVDTIVDHAEYWPHTTSVTNFESLHNGEIRVMGSQTKFLLRSRPLGFVKPLPYEVDQHPFVPAEPRRLAREYPVEQFQQWIGSPDPPTKNPCRKIVFTLRSHDQGWGGNPQDHGTYRGSWTWFEAGLERLDMIATCDESCPDHKPSEAPAPEDPAPGASEAAASASTVPASEDGPPTPSPAGSDGAGAGLARTSFQKKRDERQKRLHDAAQQEQEQQEQEQPVPRACALRPVIPQLAPEPDGGGRLQYRHELHASPAATIQHNVTVGRQARAHRVEWSWADAVGDPSSPEAEELERRGRGRASGSGDFVRSLKLGDVVTVWAMARFPGWVNVVEKVQVDVYWAI